MGNTKVTKLPKPSGHAKKSIIIHQVAIGTFLVAPLFLSLHLIDFSFWMVV
jgi:hypothetical protein